MRMPITGRANSDGVRLPRAPYGRTRLESSLNAVGTREARQIAMLQKDGVIQVGKQGEELLDVIVKYGDKAMAFIWRNKGALAVTA